MQIHTYHNEIVHLLEAFTVANGDREKVRKTDREKEKEAWKMKLKRKRMYMRWNNAENHCECSTVCTTENNKIENKKLTQMPL